MEEWKWMESCFSMHGILIGPASLADQHLTQSATGAYGMP